MATVSAKLEGLDKIMAALDPKAYRAAVSTTVREVGRAARSELSKSIREQYTVKASKIKEAVRTYQSGDSVVMQISSEPLPLTAFKMSRLRSKKGSGGVSVEIKKGSGKKRIKGAFWVGSLNGQVFKRVMKYDKRASKEQKRVMRSRIAKAVSLSVASMTHEDRQREILEKMTEKFWARYRHNLERKLWN